MSALFFRKPIATDEEDLLGQTFLSADSSFVAQRASLYTQFNKTHYMSPFQKFILMFKQSSVLTGFVIFIVASTATVAAARTVNPKLVPIRFLDKAISSSSTQTSSIDPASSSTGANTSQDTSASTSTTSSVRSENESETSEDSNKSEGSGKNQSGDSRSTHSESSENETREGGGKGSNLSKGSTSSRSSKSESENGQDK